MTYQESRIYLEFKHIFNKEHNKSKHPWSHYLQYDPTIALPIAQ